MLIKRGAEAELYKKNNELIKKRIKKNYRQDKLDLILRKRRTKYEVRMLEKIRKIGVPVPKIISVGPYEIKLEFLEGTVLKEILDKNLNLCKKIGENIAKLHKNGIIHGDLTTSNMILKDNKVYFIDFGLGFHSERIEDKAMDLHLLKQVLSSTHPEISEKAFSLILESYEKSYEKSKDVLKRLEKIEQRGRYKK